MSGSEDNKSWFRYRDAMSTSTKLMQQDENEEALWLLDDAIGMAIRENETRWVLTLSHHAAAISNFLGSLSRVKNYYEKSLTFNPENPRALAGLADVLKEQGEFELAKGYAARCYRALIEGDDFLKKERLETLLKSGQRPPSARRCAALFVCRISLFRLRDKPRQSRSWLQSRNAVQSGGDPFVSGLLRCLLG
jgi:tetratricopeptide (TPR) repeat protein